MIQTPFCPGAYPRFKKWGRRTMASVRNEAPKAEGWGVSRGPPPHEERVRGGGYAPSPNLFSIFELKMASFGAFWELIL